jgi:hypothetical protein
MFLFVPGEECDNQYGPNLKVTLPEPEATFPAVKGPTS